MSYADIAHLEALDTCLELCGARSITALPVGMGAPPWDVSMVHVPVMVFILIKALSVGLRLVRILLL